MIMMTMTMMMMMPTTTTTALWLQGIPSMNIVLIKRLNKSIFFMVINICCKGVNKHNADVPTLLIGTNGPSE